MFDRFVGAGLLMLGVGYIAAAMHRRRHPDWRQAGWWARHKWAAFLVFPDRPFFLESGKSTRKPRETVMVVLSLVVGAVVALAGVAALLSGNGRSP